MLNTGNFSKRLEKILEFYGLTAAALAEEIDFNRSTISHLVSGRNRPSLEFVMKLLQKFPELDMDWLVLGKGNFPTTSSPSSKSLEKKAKPVIEKQPELFSDLPEENIHALINDSSKKEIERITIFFKDGTYKVYEN